MPRHIRLDESIKKRLDAIAGDGAGVFFERQLEAIDPITYEVIKKELLYSEDVPVNTSTVPEGAQSYTFRIYDSIGMAKLISDYAADFPTAEVIGDELTLKVFEYGSSYNYSEKEIRAAMAANPPLNLDGRKAAAARRMQNEKHNQIAYIGDSDNNGVIDYGLINNSNVTIDAAANGAGGNSEWSTKTADEIVDDVLDARASMKEVSRNKINPNTLLLPTAQYAIVERKRFNKDGNNSTILQEFQSYGLDVKSRDELTNGFTSGTEDGFVLYEKDRMYMEFMVAMPTKSYPPLRENLVYKILLESAVVGTVIRYPIALRYVTGI